MASQLTRFWTRADPESPPGHIHAEVLAGSYIAAGQSGPYPCPLESLWGKHWVQAWKPLAVKAGGGVGWTEEPMQPGWETELGNALGEEWYLQSSGEFQVASCLLWVRACPCSALLHKMGAGHGPED